MEKHNVVVFDWNTTLVNETDGRDAHTGSVDDGHALYQIYIFTSSIVIIHRGDVETLYRFLLRMFFIIYSLCSDAVISDLCM